MLSGYPHRDRRLPRQPRFLSAFITLLRKLNRRKTYDTDTPLMGRTSRHHTGMAAIAVFKLFKGMLLLLVGFGLLELMHADLVTLFSLLLESLHLHADTRLMHALMLKVEALQPHSILIAGAISLGYAALLLTEGIGLWLELWWGAFVAAVSNSRARPFGDHELTRRG